MMRGCWLLALLCLAACGPGADRGNPIRYAGNSSGGRSDVITKAPTPGETAPEAKHAEGGTVVGVDIHGNTFAVGDPCKHNGETAGMRHWVCKDGKWANGTGPRIWWTGRNEPSPLGVEALKLNRIADLLEIDRLRAEVRKLRESLNRHIQLDGLAAPVELSLPEPGALESEIPHPKDPNIIWEAGSNRVRPWRSWSVFDKDSGCSCGASQDITDITNWKCKPFPGGVCMLVFVPPAPAKEKP